MPGETLGKSDCRRGGTQRRTGSSPSLTSTPLSLFCLDRLVWIPLTPLSSNPYAVKFASGPQHPHIITVFPFHARVRGPPDRKSPLFLFFLLFVHVCGGPPPPPIGKYGKFGETDCWDDCWDCKLELLGPYTTASHSVL